MYGWPKRDWGSQVDQIYLKKQLTLTTNMVGLDELDLKEALEDKIAKAFTKKKMKI